MIALESMAVEMPEVAGHPNRMAFRGVLAVVDWPSERAPSGARGHRVVLTRTAAEAALPSLLGMALDYAPSLDRHDVRRKVGVITRAEIEGRDLELGGYLFAKDFPEIVDEIAKAGRGVTAMKTRSPEAQAAQVHRKTLAAMQSSVRANGAGCGAITLKALAVGRGRTRMCASDGAGLGMSYEVTDVHLADTRSKVWMLTRVTFTGAAILRRDKAAYPETWIELC